MDIIIGEVWEGDFPLNDTLMKPYLLFIMHPQPPYIILTVSIIQKIFKGVLCIVLCHLRRIY